jgi:hypothetical protein
MKIHTVVFWVIVACSLVGCYRRFGKTFSVFKIAMSALKMETVCSSETLVITYYTIPCHKPEEHNMNSHCYVNFSGLYNMLWSFKNCFKIQI